MDGIEYSHIESAITHGGSPKSDRSHNGPPPPAGSLGAMIGQFKSRATKQIWAISEYIQDNLFNWDEDQLHPAARPNPFNQDQQHG
ncbi:MAG: hypothetical protein R6V73_13460 [Anaerolineales bacterium]|jgi:hypothetical protein